MAGLFSIRPLRGLRPRELKRWAVPLSQQLRLTTSALSSLNGNVMCVNARTVVIPSNNITARLILSGDSASQ